MNLLIVDDQVKVVQGLLNGVDWNNYSIDRVFGATSVTEALEIFAHHKIDVLLSDIEMPVETGLSLIAWVNKQNFNIRCILLSAHAKFDYAQQSLKLNVFDYILQPAPYDQIASTVQRAVDNLIEENEKKHLTNLGETFTYSEKSIVGGALRDWLSFSKNHVAFNRYAALDKLPTEDAECVLMNIQILRWTGLENWKPSLLEVAIENITQELFASYGGKLVITGIDKSNYLLLLWGGDSTVVHTILPQQIHLFVSLCEKYLSCICAVYCSRAVNRDALPAHYTTLKTLRENNISRKSGVYFEADMGVAVPVQPQRMPEVALWAQQLAGERPAVVEQEAVAILDEMAKNEQTNLQTLRNFYQDFLQAFHSALGANNTSWHETLSDAEKFKVYCDAACSIEQMKEFIHLAVSHFTQRTALPEQDLMRKIDEYIDEHMDEEVSRQDVAAQVYLNADYLNRVVRKVANCSLKEYVVQRKLNHARTLLATTYLPVALVSTKVGYVNSAHFSVAYKKQFGMTPMQTRQQKKNG